jgi:hypothetical protein
VVIGSGWGHDQPKPIRDKVGKIKMIDPLMEQ